MFITIVTTKSCLEAFLQDKPRSSAASRTYSCLTFWAGIPTPTSDQNNAD